MDNKDDHITAQMNSTLQPESKKNSPKSMFITITDEKSEGLDQLEFYVNGQRVCFVFINFKGTVCV